MIIGAGLAGLIAAHAFNKDIILEAGAQPTESHKALLRFRTDDVSRLTGIPFKGVTVRKGIFMNGRFVEPTIQSANLYAQKVIGRLADRSIWNLEPVTRFIAPENFYEQMLEQVGDRVCWSSPFQFSAPQAEPVISTAPLHIMARDCGLDTDGAEFQRESITVRRYRVDGANVHQTVYFPARCHSLYRASITGDLLICEFAGHIKGEWLGELLDAFGLHNTQRLEQLDEVNQRYGKIAPIPEDTRRRLVIQLSERHNIFSLGRFATWRNLLLDDVVDDIAVVKRLIRACDYERKLIGAK